MQILNVEHPDILEFVNCKLSEEKKAQSLIDIGYDGSVNGEAYSSVFFQNANLSVRVSDDYMEAYENDLEWCTRAVTSGEIVERHKARDIMKAIVGGAWGCGDPGLQFDDNTNKWNTCLDTQRINSSNPCSEYVFIDDSACNLASLNLLKFIDDEGNFDVEKFCHAVHVMTTAMDILVDKGRYPTEKIAENSHLYRPLGLGYANLGALLMSLGLPYDSDESRAYAATITSLMTAQSYLTSTQLASHVGAFECYSDNTESFIRVMNQHKNAMKHIEDVYVPKELFEAASNCWRKVLREGKKNGFRNAQVSVLAPTGTIAFMMDCDTTGIEPDIALVKYKKMVDGGMMKMVNGSVRRALIKLGYSNKQIEDMLKHLESNETIEDAPHIRDDHLPVFDCALKPKNGIRSIHYKGHIRMMASCQPFLSGAISKTVNLPESVTPEEIEKVYLEAWKLGLKAVAIYRDGCKRSQPLNTSLKKHEPVRRRLPDERQSITHKFSIGGHKGYLTVGMYEDGTLGEIFVTMAKQGSTISGLTDTFATAISLSLQYGVPLEDLVRKFTYTRFEPSGFTQNKDIKMAKSVVDYIFQWLSIHFLESKGVNDKVESLNGNGEEKKEDFTFQKELDAPLCINCGEITVRNGSCHACMSCGTSNGCS